MYVGTLEYLYDSVGNITQIRDKRNSLYQYQDFEYDALDRLIDARTSTLDWGEAYVRVYAYDAIGNLDWRGDEGTTIDYSYPASGQGSVRPHAVMSLWQGSNQVGSFSYDANGNMTTRKVGSDTYTHTWDAENRLTQVKKNGVVVATFVMDDLRQRLACQ